MIGDRRCHRGETVDLFSGEIPMTDLNGSRRDLHPSCRVPADQPFVHCSVEAGGENVEAVANPGGAEPFGRHLRDPSREVECMGGRGL